MANALVFQAELSESDARVDPVDTALSTSDPRTAFAEHWNYICAEINYVPIFRLAAEVLRKLPARAETNAALRTLVGKIQDIVSNRAALRHDLMGRVYHKLLLEAKFLGTFYTSVPAATLLMKLALAPNDWGLDWTEPTEIGSLRVADIACGTGTLLMAAEQAIVDNFVRKCAEQGESIGSAQIAAIHTILIEKVLHGYDVLPSAVHLTASTLALLAVDTSFRTMHLYSMPYGVGRHGHVSLGSLDYYSAESLRPQITFLVPESVVPSAGATTGTGTEESLAPLPALDLCCINPPFTRSAGKNLLFGSLPASERAAMQVKLREILQEAGKRGRVDWNNTAGLGAMFVAIAAARIKPGGRLALVLPAAVAFGPSWLRTRQVIERDFKVDYIVASHDASRWAFSENTELSEILLVATKRNHNGTLANHSLTKVVNITRNATNPVDALAIGEAILSTDSPPLIGADGEPASGVRQIWIGGQKRAEVFTIPDSAIRHAQWNWIAFAQTDLNRIASLVERGKLRLPGLFESTKLDLAPLKSFGQIGPDGRDVYDAFGISALQTQYDALWGYDAAKMNTLAASANKHLSPLVDARKGRSLRNVKLIWPRAGRLLIPDKIWLVTRTAVAIRTNRPVLSNVWWPIHVNNNDASTEKILALWFNSTIGLLLLLWGRVPTRGPFIKFKKPQLHELPVVNCVSLSNAQQEALCAAFDRLSRRALMALSQMHQDPVRIEIDKALSDTLDIPDLEPLRRMLSMEPIISDRQL